MWSYPVAQSSTEFNVYSYIDQRWLKASTGIFIFYFLKSLPFFFFLHTQANAHSRSWPDSISVFLVPTARLASLSFPSTKTWHLELY